MTYQTHAYLGESIFPVICETWGVKLSRKRFVRGCVLPDMNTLFIRHPHFWRHSRKYIARKIAKLAQKTLKPGGKNKRFSENLGIILHYVADFFTSAHNSKSLGFRAHLEFEDRLHEEFLRLVDSKTIQSTLRLIDDRARNAEYGPGEILENLHSAFKPSIDNPLNDIKGILVACLSVTDMIMDAAAVYAPLRPIRATRSTRRFENPHSLSYQDKTFTILPPVTLVSVLSKVLACTV